MRALRYKKDTKAFCKNCDSLYFVLSRDVFSGDLISQSRIYDDKGQAPFFYQEKMICKKCSFPLNEEKLRFE